jgi:hypothetical protein
VSRRASDFAEAIVGLRLWHFGRGEPELHSRGNRAPWPAGRAQVAVCYLLPHRMDGGRWVELEPHPAPRRRCRCGIYALKTPEAVAELRRAHRPRHWHPSPLATLVSGEVSLWGRLIEHEHGYRAEYAYPRRILVPHDYRGFLHADDGRTIRRIYADEAAALIAARYRIETDIE